MKHGLRVILSIDPSQARFTQVIPGRSTHRTTYTAHVARCRHPDEGRRTSRSARRRYTVAKRNRDARHARRDCARSSFLSPSILVPGPSIARPSILGHSSISLRAAQNDGRGQRCKRERGALCRSLHAGRGAARGMRRVCSSDGRTRSGPGVNTPGHRDPPSPPPPSRPRRTQQSELHFGDLSRLLRSCRFRCPAEDAVGERGR